MNILLWFMLGALTGSVNTFIFCIVLDILKESKSEEKGRHEDIK